MDQFRRNLRLLVRERASRLRPLGSLVIWEAAGIGKTALASAALGWLHPKLSETFQVGSRGNLPSQTQ